jgi:hypothetical protein
MQIIITTPPIAALRLAQACLWFFVIDPLILNKLVGKDLAAQRRLL